MSKTNLPNSSGRKPADPCRGSGLNDLQAELLLNEPLAKYTSWHVGGPARQFFKPANISNLAEFLRSLALTEMLLWIGLGSNLLIRDGGIPGTVIYTQG